MNSRLKKFAKENAPFALPAFRAVLSYKRHFDSRRKIRNLLGSGAEILVEVGSGDRPGERGWTTIDITRNCDVYWDLRRGLPFPDNSVNKIYSSHFFEHLSFNETQGFLSECRRAMAPGGKFLICVPNARIYLEAYINNAPLDTSVFFGYTPAYNHTTPIDSVNYVAYMDGEHKYMFDEENLLFILSASGFRNVRLRPFDPALDLKDRDFESIYAEAEK